jgi:hypothetical protein
MAEKKIQPKTPDTPKPKKAAASVAKKETAERKSQRYSRRYSR